MWSFPEKGMAHWKKALLSQVLRSLGSGFHVTGLGLTSETWCVTLFQVTMSLSALVSSPVNLELKDRTDGF